MFSPDTTLDRAIAYALDNPGKRLRSRLTITTAELIAGEPVSAAIRVGDAIEYLHTYSLIHDDLPAMDDDDLRRGKPTLHRAFNEATAILAGDGLQALAFEQLASIDELSPSLRVELIRLVSRAVGLNGMVGGQALDLAAEGSQIDHAALTQIHRLKTGALIEAAVIGGALSANASEWQISALQRFAENIGLAFQVMDDVLDVSSDSAMLGKTAGKDAAAQKSTYVALLGIEGAREEAETLLSSALSALSPFAEAASDLVCLAQQMVRRER
jgi:geranylgeranyl pyrophosphate synthase